MASIGRNEPCPCGSGRKYKRCCLGGSVLADDTVSVQDRDIAFSLLDDLVGAARYQADLAAVSPLVVDGDVSLLDDEDEIMSSRVVDWLTLDVVLRRQDGTIAADALRRRGADLPAGARRFLRDLLGAPLRLMQVDSDLDDEHPVWWDLLDEGRSYQMAEDTELFDPGDVIVARIVERDGAWVVEDIPAILWLDDVEEMAQSIQQVRDRAMADGATPDIVRMVLGAALLRLVANAEVTDEPILTEEGDPLSPTISTWDVTDGEALVARLGAADDFTRDPDASGEAAAGVRWTWSGPPFEGADTSPLATLTLRPGRLETRVASLAREERVRGRLDALAGDLIRYIGARSLTPDDLRELADTVLEGEAEPRGDAPDRG